ncbi:NAD(P)-binding protein [Rhizophagus irregularis]|uniref:NAD(P)-binding protein n=1 Tax=Rhizophagus irregularis TaxID=588596 RepID=A0A2I1FUH6_9GLOM|nr:NAD(P)-binding protein [Rhizophagus irregularis]
MNTELSGRVVLITGASAGIGEATALEFAKYNSKLILLARRAERLQKLKSQILEKYPNTQIHTCEVDVRNKQAIDNVIANLPQELKDIDVLVNNAGIAIGFETLENQSQEEIQATLETNVNGLIYVTQAVLPRMKERNSGDIIIMGSISGKQSHGFGNSIYSASKFAVEGITDSLRKELVKTKIRVLLIRPGSVETEFTLNRSRGNSEFSKIYYSGYEPLDAKDIAECVVFGANRPTNVVISELNVLPNAQVDTVTIHRDNDFNPMKALSEKYKN